MSKSLEGQYDCLKNLSSQMRGTSSNDICFAKENRERWHDAYLLWVAIVLDARGSSDRCRLEDAQTFLSLYSQGSQGLSAMKELLLTLRTHVLREGTSYRNFKRSYLHNRKGAVPIFQILEKLLKEYILAPSALTFHPLNDILSFLGRLTLTNSELKASAIEKFVKADDIVITASDDEIEEVTNIITGWLDGFKPDLSYGCHGPGASFGMLRRDSTPDRKFETLRATPLLRYAGADVEAYEEGPDEPSEIVFVPKSADSLRTICKVPAWKMFWQKPVQMQLYSFIEHSALRRHLCFSRQDYSQKLCLLGSRDDSFYTIDLSAASDTVAWELVRRVFRRTSLLRILFATRSRKYLVRGGMELVPKKFDPMGSALTFPVESLIFAAVCESTAVRRKPRYRVYGDDIICHPADIPSDALIAKLERFGFTVNTTKSYTKGSFREACGCEAYEGTDVSPLRLSRRWRSLTPKSPDDVAGLRELANHCLIRGYRLARLLIIRRIKRTSFWKYCWFGDVEEENCWWSFHATNFDGLIRWNEQLQRSERPDLMTRQSRARGSDQYRFYVWNADRYWSSEVQPALSDIPWGGPPKEALSGTGKLRSRTRIAWLATSR